MTLAGRERWVNLRVFISWSVSFATPGGLLDRISLRADLSPTSKILPSALFIFHPWWHTDSGILQVKCGGERPSCGRCIARNDTCLYKLSPTLTYTERLENQVKELKSLISQLQSQSTGSTLEAPGLSHPALQNPPTPGEVSKIEGSFEGLKFDDKGAITYHGATSFFQLLRMPATQEQNPNSSSWEIPSYLDDGGLRRKRLVNNAWQQRALETMSKTPVSLPQMRLQFLIIRLS